MSYTTRNTLGLNSLSHRLIIDIVVARASVTLVTCRNPRKTQLSSKTI